MRKCSTCGVESSLENFHKNQHYCKPCASIRRKAYYVKNKDRERVLTNKWLLNNRLKVRNNQLKHYGINQDDYNALKAAQKDCCAICNRHESVVPRSNYEGPVQYSLHVDHCHETGTVRGLLCFNCNAMLGKARDDIKVLQEAIKYLTKEERNK